MENEQYDFEQFQKIQLLYDNLVIERKAQILDRAIYQLKCKMPCEVLEGENSPKAKCHKYFGDAAIKAYEEISLEAKNQIIIILKELLDDLSC